MNMDFTNNTTTNINERPSALNAIAAEFDAVDWKYTQFGSKLQFRFPSPPLTGDCVIAVQGHFALVLVSPGILLPEAARPSALTLINRKNWELLMGNVEMDETDGEVRLRYTYPLVNGQLDGDRAVKAIMQLCSIMQEFVPDLLEVMVRAK